MLGMNNLLDIQNIRKKFSILYDNNLIYFDNASTSLKPDIVIDKIKNYYSSYPANVHRSIYKIGLKASEEYENVRKKIKEFLNAESTKNIIFTSGTTESINLISHSWGLQNLNENDEILLTEMEHHSNIVPWQICSQKTGCKIRYIAINDQGELDLSNINELINEKTKLVSLIHQSNVLGTVNPIKEIIQIAKKQGAITLIDAAQTVPHLEVDVKEIDCDFLVFSGHKMVGPTGVGILYGKENILDGMQPFMSGGQMINEVNLHSVTFNELPLKFEAGTPNIAQVIGLGESIDFISKIGINKINEYERYLTEYALAKLRLNAKIALYANSKHQGSVISFNIQGINAYDLAEFLDQKNIAVRVGHHCAQPLMKVLGVPSTIRISFYLYNTIEEIDFLILSIEEAIKFFLDRA